MAFKTRFTEMFGLKHPVMCGGMQNAANPELTIAVSEAGGLGVTNISMYPDLDDFRAAVKRIRSATKNPFAVNISMIPGVSMGDKIAQYIKICGEEGVNVIETAGQNPVELIPQIREYGMKIIHKVPAVKHAQKAESVGVDAVTIVGSEAAGHPSPDLIGTIVVANKAARLVKIPVLCGGGIADGRGLVAALALGAEGVVMGTRFLTAKECCISDNHKQWILDHSERDTVLPQKSIKNMVRVANNENAMKVLEVEEKGGATLETLMPLIAGSVGKEAYRTGDTSKGMFPVGQNIGIIGDIKSAKDIIEEIIAEGLETVGRIDGLVSR